MHKLTLTQRTWWFLGALVATTLTLVAVLLLSKFFKPQASEEPTRSDLPDATAELGIRSITAPETPSPQPTKPTRSTDAITVASQRADEAVLVYQSGDFNKAVELLREANHLNPDDKEIADDLSVALYALALLKIQQKAFYDADQLLEKSNQLGFSDAANMLARLRIRAGETGPAVEELLQTGLNGKEDPRTLALLVDLSLSRDDLASAEIHFRRLEEALLQQPGAIPTAFVKARADRLAIRRVLADNTRTIDRTLIKVVYSLPQQQPLAEAAADAIEKSLNQFVEDFFPLKSEDPLQAVIFPVESFHQSTGAPPWAGAFFDGTIRIPAPSTATVISLALVGKVARHEAAHAYLHDHCGNTLPSWLHEGFALRNEGTPLHTSLTTLRVRRGNDALALPESMSLDGAFITADPTDISELYARSHLLVAVLERQTGSDFWKPLIAQVCQEEEPLEPFLTSRFGHGTANGLWTAFASDIAALLMAQRTNTPGGH